MAAPSLFLHQSICNLGSTRSSVYASNNSYQSWALSLRLRGSTSSLSPRIVLNPSTRGVSGPKTMNKSVTNFAWRDGGSNDRGDRIGVFEEEVLINDSSDLRDQLAACGGFEATANRLSKWVVAAFFGSVLLLRHDGTALWAVIGSVSNSMLSVALKRILNQERPLTTLRSDPGMPSSHAQSISFISVFAVLSVLEWLGISQVSLFLCSLILASGSYFTWLRVSQKLHTVSQVVVGAIVGSVFSIIWYRTWETIVLEAFLSSYIVQLAVFLAATAFTLGFVVYVAYNWLRDDR